MTDAPNEAPPPAARPSPARAPKPPRKQGPPLLKNPTYLLGLSLLLLVLCGTALFLGWRHRALASKYMRRERDHHTTMWRVEHFRSALARADRMGRMPGLDGRMVEDIHEQCSSVVEFSSETLGAAPALEELWRVRGQAQEMRYNFDEAIKDYAESIALLEAETARYRDQEHVPFAIGYMHRGFLRLRMVIRRMLLDEDDEALRKAAFDDLLHAYKPSSDEAMKSVALVAQNVCRLELEEAIRHAGVAERFDPTDWRPLLCRAAARFRLKDVENALRDLSDATRLYPYGAEIHAWRARCLHRLGRREEADRSLASAQTVDPNFFEAYLLRGRLLADDGRFAQAEEHLRLACERRPDHPAARQEHAAAAHEAWLRSGRADRALLDRALESLSAALNLDPQNAATYVLRARVHLARGAPDVAITDAGLALSIAKSADAHRVRAEAQAACGDWSSAARDYQAAGDPRGAARALAKAKEHAAALRQYEALLKLDPSDASLATECARVLLDCGRADEALRLLDATLERSPGVTPARLLKAEVLLSQNDVAASVAEATLAYEADPQPDALIVRGRAHARAGRKPEARRDWEKAKELAPGRAAEIDALLRTLD